ncbi:DUF2752 domain-containing protein [Streptomyces barkulensis]|uniref:DUF2752 domain-containing protein n=1 Tax=Streptomyces barkulensis TaxID=1257026 RepID=UPI000C6CC888|nr:DUF2752 domain-containing protein [Streptomyces barkulensis]
MANTQKRWWPPLRPVLESRDRHPWAGPTALAGLVAGAAVAVFGLPPVDLHSPLHYAGVMGPTCGGTRAVHAAALGHFGESWRYNPLGLPVLVGAFAAVAREAVGRRSGRWLNVRVTHRRTAVVCALVLLAALAANQQAHAELLRTGPETGVPTGLLLYAVVVPLTAVAVAVRLYRSRHPGHHRPPAPRPLPASDTERLRSPEP